MRHAREYILARRPLAFGPRFAGMVVALCLCVLMLLVVAAETRASEVSKWEGRLVRHRFLLEQLVERQHELQVDIRAMRRERNQRWNRVRGRLASIYRAGGHLQLHHALVSSRSMGEVADTAQAIAAVAEHDRKALVAYDRLGHRIKRAEAKLDQVRDDVEDAKTLVIRDRRKLAAARAAARKARERAERLARQPRSPLAPAAVSAQSVAAVLAGEDPQSPSAPSGFVQTGIASVYHDSFTGERTANGEIYDPNALTAAHLTLPLGTWVLVTGPGGSAMVRINDRGPYIGGRIIDLSRASAAAVGLPGLGTVTVQVQ